MAQGGWWKLVSIVDEARDIDEQDRDNTPSSCVQCYTPLLQGTEGKLYCPWDGLTWPDDAQAWGEFPGSY